MNNNEFFPPRPSTNPTIYAYELAGVSTHVGLIKIGFTSRNAVSRVSEQLKTSGLKYRIVFEESAMKCDGSSFTDHDIHRNLRRQGFANPEGEWFKCTINDLRKAIYEIKTGERTEANRVLSFGMSKTQLLKRQLLISRVLRRKIPRKPLIFFGMPKCDLGKHSRVISWQKRWDGQKSWYSHLNLP